MNRPTFGKSAFVGALICAGAAVGLSVLTMLFAFPFALNLLIAGIAGSYIVYLLAETATTVGRMTAAALWLAGTICVTVLGATALETVAFQAACIWLVRTLYFHSGLLSALLDLCLVGLGLILALSTYTHTNSALLSLWCFLLIQALFVAIPDLGAAAKDRSAHTSEQDSNIDFEQARRRAEVAVQQLITR